MLSRTEIEKRYNRLNCLRVLCEGHEEGEGYNIWVKSNKALDKLENGSGSGIIRLTIHEKDFLSYKYMDDSMLSDEEDKVLEFYLRYTEEIIEEAKPLREKEIIKKYLKK